MNENFDLTKILEGCPEGTKFYSPIFGEVEFIRIDKRYANPIVTKVQTRARNFFSKEGYYYDFTDAECLLFPSKDQRDWSKFERFWDKPKVERFNLESLQPFDKILVRDSRDYKWSIGLFSYYDAERDNYPVVVGSCNRYAIPYNDETKHLVGTYDDCPEYYKWWEE